MCPENIKGYTGTTHADNPDCWIGVDDPKKRKQIQDRLAQRARRRRLAEARDRVDDPSKSRSRQQPAQPRDENISAITTSTPNFDCGDSMSIISIPLNVYSALWRNGQMLGLSCGQLVPTMSKTCGPETPVALQPTDLQLVTLHPTWIDRFPFPQFRDNFIALLGVIDHEEFIGDLFNRPSFILKSGGDSWDPSAWSIDESFRQKWGFLFDPDLFDPLHA